tara:strand:+ start:900 stop:1361 length:462 start_codon:yes stop_codon:yes gene_type:complete
LQRPTVIKRFEDYLKRNNLKLTPQRQQVFEKVFSTNEHFSAERLYELLREEEGDGVSRATVYRALEVLAKGGFVETLETGRGEVLYEHKGPNHHDHMVCVECSKIEEFHDERIEELQERAAEAIGFVIVSHVHRLTGLCRACAAQNGSSKQDG